MVWVCSQFSSVAWAYHQHFIEIFSIFLLLCKLNCPWHIMNSYFWNSKRPLFYAGLVKVGMVGGNSLIPCLGTAISKLPCNSTIPDLQFPSCIVLYQLFISFTATLLTYELLHDGFQSYLFKFTKLQILHNKFTIFRLNTIEFTIFPSLMEFYEV